MNNLTITTTEKKSIKRAKQELAAQCNRQRLRKSSLLIKYDSVQCVCGQTPAVKIWSVDFQKGAVVGICKHCGEN